MNKNELINVKGGISKWVYLGIGSALAFVIGVIDGYLRPLKCN